MKMKYSIEFIYSDNNQVYLDDVELELEEFTRVSAFLYALEKAGVIEKEGGGGELIYHSPSLSSAALNTFRRDGQKVPWFRSAPTMRSSYEPPRDRQGSQTTEGKHA